MNRTHKNNSSSAGVSIDVVVATVFIILKLVGVINWSWWWVLSPLWIGLGIAVLFGLIIIIGLVLNNR
jgi:hypothetical protein